MRLSGEKSPLSRMGFMKIKGNPLVVGSRLGIDRHWSKTFDSLEFED